MAICEMSELVSTKAAGLTVLNTLENVGRA